MRKILKLVAPVLVLAAGVGSVMVLAAAKEAPEKKEEVARPISLYVDEVRAENVVLSVRTQGEVRPKTEIDLVPQVSGRIVSISESFAEGAGFAPNEVLIQIEDADYQLTVTSAEARLAEAKVKLEQEMADARIKRKQWQDWVKDGEPTPLALNQPQVAEAQAKLRAAEADLDNAKLNLSRTKIKVPFKGRVLERTAGVGQYVTVGAKLGRVFATDKVEIRLPLTDSQLSELNLPIGFVASGDNAPAVNVRANLGSGEHVWKGRIVRTHASVDKQTRLMYAVAEVEDPYGKTSARGMPLAVGLFVSAEIEGVKEQSALVMPRDALRSENKVYVIKDDKLEIRSVDVLSTSAEHVMVTAGVAAGEKVVTSPVRGAHEGMSAVPITRSAKNDLDSASR
ncbi:efflux RND transporter periplasmic adaptor subunit [Kordiimonas aestuarii]|uniref:efflux RND transporter periplasmic adaptor subunit n=1 Tax=Kordiimonas aestuarii TaxID=1005925 RepID=UPI0021CFF924|nr:efflux RND transporter periplasmic adaptor subunit [Kordiimonas aestuarii]